MAGELDTHPTAFGSPTEALLSVIEVQLVLVVHRHRAMAVDGAERALCHRLTCGRSGPTSDPCGREVVHRVPDQATDRQAALNTSSLQASDAAHQADRQAAH